MDYQGMNGVKKTYLDTSGRPVFEFRKSALVAQHSQRFELTFSIENVSIFGKPLLLVIGTFLVLLGAIFFARWERSIIPPDSISFTNQQKRFEELLLELKDLQCERADLYDKFEKTILKSPNKIENSISSLEKDIQTSNKDFSSIEQELKKYNNEMIIKSVRNLAKHENTRFEIFRNFAKSLQEEKGKLREEIEDSLKKKSDEISELISGCISDITDEMTN